jgi:hypothetical protein
MLNQIRKIRTNAAHFLTYANVELKCKKAMHTNWRLLRNGGRREKNTRGKKMIEVSCKNYEKVTMRSIVKIARKIKKGGWG